ncbi:MAG: hypothetical protein WB791_05455 [Waddliaceae bacterium]
MKQKDRPPFAYVDKGEIAAIGRTKAVGRIGKHNISGFTAWIIWCCIHIFYLVGFSMKVLVMIQWLASFLTGGRPVRLIIKPIDKEEHW